MDRHPDKNKSPRASEKFMEINGAYEVKTDYALKSSHLVVTLSVHRYCQIKERDFYMIILEKRHCIDLRGDEMIWLSIGWICSKTA